MKKLILVAAAAFVFAGSTFANTVDPNREDVNEKVLKVFENTFPTVSELKWKEYEDYYSASFRQNGTLTEVRYDKEGNFLSSLRYYKEEMLPLSVLNEVKKDYSKKSVFGVTELTVGSTVNYFIKLEDEKCWTTVRADQAGNLTMVEKYRKA